MRQYKHKKPKPRSANKTDRKLERASHDGFKLVHHEKEWGFQEGKAPKNILNKEEARNIDKVAKKRGINRTNAFYCPKWEVQFESLDHKVRTKPNDE